MKRNNRLVEKRRKRIAVFMELKKQEPDFHWRTSVYEIAELLCLAPVTVWKELTRYNKSKEYYI